MASPVPATNLVTLSLSALTFNIHGFVSNFWTGWKKERRIGELLQKDDTGKRFDFFLATEAWDPIASKIIAYKAGYENAIHSLRPEPCKFSVYGNGISIMTDWKIVDMGHETWKNFNSAQWEGPHGAMKGFTFVKLQHKSHENARVIVYNLHGSAAEYKQIKTEKQIWENYDQLAQHIKRWCADDAVIVGGDFNWRHRWRADGARPEDGPRDQSYNARFPEDYPRYDVYGNMCKVSGLVDVEYILTKKLEHLSSVDRFFVKQGKDVTINVTKSQYLYTDTPWHGLSDHHPVSLYFDLTFPGP